MKNSSLIPAGNTLRNKCAVCDSRHIVTALPLPNLPLTGVFLKPGEKDTYGPIDQELLFCEDCGHGQLKVIPDPKKVYNGTYFHRSGESKISAAGNTFLANFIWDCSGGRVHKKAFDLGCNDGHLLNLLATKERVGVDPIWKNKKSKFIGKFAEELTPADIGRPDLFVSSHTFEHVENPKEQLGKIVECTAEGANGFIEVPCLDSMITNSRWDQVFHQHLHYFSFASMQRLLKELGCSVVTMTRNMNYWGGTLLVYFVRGKADQEPRKKPQINDIIFSVRRFTAHMTNIASAMVDLSEEPLVGFGAAQMLPTIAYHLQTDMSELRCVYDDNAKRRGLGWPGLGPRIEQTPASLEDFNVLVTALDSSRQIMKRCTELGAKRIIIPAVML